VQELEAVMNGTHLLVCSVVLLTACSSSSKTPPASSSDFTHDVTISMELTVKAGEELHTCQFVALPSDTDVNVVSLSHRYTAGSHHFLVYSTDLDTVPADMQGQYDCVTGNEPVMQHARGILYGAQSPDGTFPLPEGVGFRMKAHQVLMLQAHYINVSSHDLVAKVSAGFDTAPADTIRQQAGFLIFYDPFIYLPPLSEATSGIRCAVPSDINLITGFTHYHQRGRQMSVWVDPSMSAQSQEPFFQTDDWEHPLDFRGPLAVPAGSAIRMRCDYKNTDPVDVFQGPNASTSEMCVFAGLYYPEVPGEFETCAGLSVTGTGTSACPDLLTCVQACPGTEAPEFTNAGVNVGGCWEKCIAKGCQGAADLLLPATSCVVARCSNECASSSTGDACTTCATMQCAAELNACFGQTCAM
jgi:Copper type II ascorbate-dependent monooxygenase, C-terminal domain